jgi:hypothetical protein
MRNNTCVTVIESCNSYEEANKIVSEIAMKYEILTVSIHNVNSNYILTLVYSRQKEEKQNTQKEERVLLHETSSPNSS